MLLSSTTAFFSFVIPHIYDNMAAGKSADLSALGFRVGLKVLKGLLDLKCYNPDSLLFLFVSQHNHLI